MKKTVGIVAVVLLAAITAIVALRVYAANPVAPQADVSERTSKILQGKIDAIKAAEKSGIKQLPRTVEVSEPELESYVLYGLKNDIPAKVETIDVQLTEGAVAADTRLT